MPYSWVDIVIVLVVLYHLYDGWERGSLSLVANMGSFLISLWLAVRFQVQAGSFVIEKFGVAASWANVVSYVGVALISQIVLDSIFLWAIRKLPVNTHTSKINKWLGGVLSGINGILIIMFLLLLTLSLPLRGMIKRDIQTSVLGSRLVYVAEKYGGQVRSSLEEAAKEAVKFLTIEPGSHEQVPIDIPIHTVFTIDAKTESDMVALVNKERTSRGLAPLVADASTTEVARGKSRDMFERKYFSHYDPDGKNAADRMNEANVTYSLVGENLAYAPDLASAHAGLMNSEGHRKNILEPKYHRIGIGVIDGGIYGKMFTQIFAD